MEKGNRCKMYSFPIFLCVFSRRRLRRMQQSPSSETGIKTSYRNKTRDVFLPSTQFLGCWCFRSDGAFFGSPLSRRDRVSSRGGATEFSPSGVDLRPGLGEAFSGARLGDPVTHSAHRCRRKLRGLREVRLATEIIIFLQLILRVV